MGILNTLKFINTHPLAKRHKLKAFVRFFKWQISQSLYPRLVYYPFIGETRLCVKKGMSGATGNIYTGLHEFEDMSFLLHFLRPEDLFIDIGANVGAYTILASALVGANSISIEPVPQAFEMLKRNILSNGLHTKVTPLNIGIGSDRGNLSFTKNLDTVNHVVVNEKDHNEDTLIKVAIEKLDALLAGKQIPLLLKIDVEGFEQEVINGAQALLSDTDLKAIIIELNGSGGRYGYNELKIHEQLLSYGFCSYIYNPFCRALTSTKSYGHLNTIYLRDIDFVEKRLKTADLIEVFSEKF